MLVSEIMTRVRRVFGDESAVQITDADMVRWINDGMRDIVLRNEDLLEKTAVQASVANQQEYNLPADYLVLKFIQYRETGTTSYLKLKGLRVTEFNEYLDGWSGDTSRGTPQCYTIHAGKIILFPIPSVSATDAIKTYYNRIPTDVILNTDIPEIPTLYHSTLVKYCLQQAYELDEDPESANAKSEQVAADIDMLRGREDWKAQERYPTITVLVDDQD